MPPPLVECHAHVLPDAVLARLPGGSSPRYVTAERRVLARMLEAQDACGITHALVSDSFFMETSAEELPAWSGADRARLYNDGLAALIARHRGRLIGLGCVDPWGGESAARELERMVEELGFAGALVNPSDGRRYLDDPACAPLLAGGSVDWDWQAESSKRNRAVRNSAGEWLDQHALDSRCGLVLNARKHV